MMRKITGKQKKLLSFVSVMAMAGVISASPAFSQDNNGSTAPKSGFKPVELDSPILASPSHPTTEPVSKVITSTERYYYYESKYKTPVKITTLPEGLIDTSSPEKTMFSRTTAMIRGDYEQYLSFWDDESRIFTEAEFKIGKIKPSDLVGNWKGTFRELDMVLMRHISSGDYVVLVYELKKKSDAEYSLGMEFPVIFYKNEDDWLATQNLRKDALIGISPWSTGENSVEVTVR